MFALVIGFVASVVGSIPAAGPIGMLIAARGLRDRWRDGLAIAAGAACAEAAYAGLAYAGTSAVFDAYPAMFAAARGATGLLLIPLGLTLIAAREPSSDGAPARSGGDFLLGFAIAALNPAFIATWTAVAALCHSTGATARTAMDTVLFATGAGAGGVAWAWIMLTLISRYRSRLRQSILVRLLRGIGVLLLGIGLYALLRVVMR